MTDPFCAHAREPETDAEKIARLERALAEEERRNDELADRLDRLKARIASFERAYEAAGDDETACGRLRVFYHEQCRLINERFDQQFRAEAAEARLAALEAPAADARARAREIAQQAVQAILDANSHEFDFACEADREEAVAIVENAIASALPAPEPVGAESDYDSGAVRAAAEAILPSTMETLEQAASLSAEIAAMQAASELPAPEPVGAQDGEATGARFAVVADHFPEINIANYDEDDVVALNGWGVEAAFALEDAAREVRQLHALAERASSAEAEIERLRKINSKLCSSHNSLLVDGARWQKRAEVAEARLSALEAELAEAVRLLTRAENMLRNDFDGGGGSCP